MKRMTKLGLLAATLATVWGSALADINVGVVVSATGPAASLGIPEKNTVALMPRTVAGQKVNYIILDDTTAAVANTRKLISESKVDVILGSSITPNSLAMVDVVSEAKTPMITLAASAKIVEPVDAKKFWVFKTPQHDAMMAAAIGEYLGLTAEEIARGVAAYVPTGSRMHLIRRPENRLIIDDCYNANPQAMAEALRLLARTACASRVAVLGDMGELGELTVPAHEDMGRLCRELGLDRVIAIGPKAASIARTAGEAAEHFDTIADALPALRAAFVPGTAALVKASHAMEFGKIVKELETL